MKKAQGKKRMAKKAVPRTAPDKFYAEGRPIQILKAREEVDREKADAPPPFVPPPRESFPPLHIVVPCENCGPISQGGGAFAPGHVLDTHCEMTTLANIEVHTGAIRGIVAECEKCHSKVRIYCDAGGVHYEPIVVESEPELDAEELEYAQMKSFINGDRWAERRFAKWKEGAGLGPMQKRIRNCTLGKGSLVGGAAEAAKALRAAGRY